MTDDISDITPGPPWSVSVSGPLSPVISGLGGAAGGGELCDAWEHGDRGGGVTSHVTQPRDSGRYLGRYTGHSCVVTTLEATPRRDTRVNIETPAWMTPGQLSISTEKL